MEERIIEYISTELLAGEVPDLQPEDDLLGSGLITSMAIFKLIGFLEETFGVAIPPQEMTIEHFMTVDAITSYVKQRQRVASE